MGEVIKSSSVVIRMAISVLVKQTPDNRSRIRHYLVDENNFSMKSFETEARLCLSKDKEQKVLRNGFRYSKLN